MKKLIVFFTILTSLPSVAQQSVTLEQCYQLVTENYPLTKQFQLLDAQNKLDKEVVSTANLPQVSLDAYATYQSDVIEFPLAMSGIEPLNNDQYRATVSVNQLIYNGGATDASLHLKSAQLKTKQKQLEVSLYQLKQQVNQLYFSILLAQESELLLDAKKNHIKSKLKEVQSGIKYGIILYRSYPVTKVTFQKKLGPYLCQ